MGNYAWFSSTADFLKEIENQEFVSQLKESFRESFHNEPSSEQVNSWKSEINYLRNILRGMGGSIILEYRVPGSGEKADVVIISEGEKNAVVIEMKGWHVARKRNEFIYQTDQKPPDQINPRYQLMNYVGKMRFTSSAGNGFRIEGKAILYNAARNSPDEILVFKSEEKLMESYLKSLISTVDINGNAHLFASSVYKQNKALFKAIREHYSDLRNGAVETLADRGFGLYFDQLSIYTEIIGALGKEGDQQFLIEGGPGSGKTLIAIELLIKALSMNKQSVLCYRNNRMVESLRKLFASVDRGLDGVIKYYSTGRPGNPGVAEEGWKTKLDLAIFDEAQRMTTENIILGSRAARLSVFFFDERQILSTEEKGSLANFRNALPNAVLLRLGGLYRNGQEYSDFIENLLGEKTDFNPIEDYEFRCFDDITEMISELRGKQVSNRTALLASFTESKGDLKDRNSPENIRVGYPLSSGFDMYKNSGITIKWLMEAKAQYAPFWVDGESDKLESCASIYGCQGFESDYVGVIWGRDLVFRDGKLVLGTNCEDSVGGRHSLKKLFRNGLTGDSEAYNPLSRKPHAFRQGMNAKRLLECNGLCKQ